MAITSLQGTHPRRTGDPFPGAGTSIVTGLSQELVYFDSFLGFTRVHASANLAFWRVLSGIGNGSSEISDTAGGALTITPSGSANDRTTVGSVAEVFSFRRTQPFEYEVSLQVNATTSSFYAGLGEDFTAFDMGTDGAGIREDSHIGFLLDKTVDDASIMASYGDRGGNNTTTDTGIDIVAATDTVLTFTYDGRGNWKAYVNGVQGAAITNTITNHPDQNMALYFGCDSSGTAGGSVTVNYIYLRWEF